MAVPTTTFARSATNMTGSVVANWPSASSSSTTTTKQYPANYRPNKSELEARLYHAHVRAKHRHIMATLGHGVPNTHTRKRTTRAVPVSIPREVPEPVYMIPPPTFTTAAQRERINNIITAPSPSMLPPPPYTPAFNRPDFPHRLSRLGPVRRESVGMNQYTKMSVEGDDTVFTPHHLLPNTFRRTPGAPPFAMKDNNQNEAIRSYFHLPSNLFTPALAAPTTTTNVGLGIMNVNMEDTERISLGNIGLGITGLQEDISGGIF